MCLCVICLALTAQIVAAVSTAAGIDSSITFFRYMMDKQLDNECFELEHENIS